MRRARLLLGRFHLNISEIHQFTKTGSGQKHKEMLNNRGFFCRAATDGWQSAGVHAIPQHDAPRKPADSNIMLWSSLDGKDNASSF